eukprot:m.250301 g.250301  ORF g.250301 m.250301 type:complete len:98 (+) comp54506_c0_seq8:297-590(+)
MNRPLLHIPPAFVPPPPLFYEPPPPLFLPPPPPMFIPGPTQQPMNMSMHMAMMSSMAQPEFETPWERAIRVAHERTVLSQRNREREVCDCLLSSGSG